MSITQLISIIVTLTSLALLIYFRISDAKNVTIQTLKDYLKQSENHIETMLRKKEKEFADRMIESEIIIERIHRMTSSLQDHLDRFDGDIVKGQSVFDELKNEVSTVQKELLEYKQIRSEFYDIEERIEAILNIKQQAEDGTKELRQLREKISLFHSDYDNIIGDIKDSSRQELDVFFQSMQQDLSDYLTKSRKQLTDKDEEMATQIQELSVASTSMVKQIKDFKQYSQQSIEQLKIDIVNDLEVAKSVSDVKVTDIYDMWDKLKEQTQQDTFDLLNSLNSHREFFETAEFNIRAEIDNFSDSIESQKQNLQTNLELYIQDKQHEFETRITDMHNDLENKGIQVKNDMTESLSSQTASVREELERLRLAFVDQEQGIEDRIRVLTSRVSEGLSFAESTFQTSLEELQNSVDKTKSYAEDILHNAQGQISEKISNIEKEFKQKANENMHLLEESLKESNHERLVQSISDITESLEKEFKQRYDESLKNITMKADELEEHVESRLSFIVELDQKLKEIQAVFDEEKEKIMLMCGELEKDRHDSIETIFKQVQEYVLELREELTSSVQEFLDEGKQNLVTDQETWQERYEEIIKSGRDENTRIQQDIDKIHRLINDIEVNTLGNIKRSVDRLTHEAEYRIEDFKKQTGDFFRSSKEEFHNQTTQAQESIKALRQELWAQESEMRQLVDKDIDRLGAKGKDIEKQFQVFMKKADKLDQVEDLMRNITHQQDEFQALKKEFESMNGQMKSSYQQSKEIADQLDNLHQDIDNKKEQLNVVTVEADRTQEHLLSTMQGIENLTHVFETLKEEREKVQDVEELLQKNLAVFNDLQESLQGLEHNRAVIENMQQALQESEAGLSSLSHSSEDIGERIVHMGDFANHVQEQLHLLQQEMKTLAGDQTKVHTAVSKIIDLEHISTHIDQEMKRLEKMREWIAKSMTNVDRMGAKLGINSFSQMEENNNNSDDANIRSVVRLYENGWGIDDIAKNLKLSSAYVELIIERYK